VFLEIDCCSAYVCAVNATCSQTIPDERQCTCPEGYSGTAILTGSAPHEGCLSQCQLYGCGYSVGSIACTMPQANTRVCTCPPGTTPVSDDTAPLTSEETFSGCTDINECTSLSPCNSTEDCVNLPPGNGGYMCVPQNDENDENDEISISIQIVLSCTNAFDSSAALQNILDRVQISFQIQLTDYYFTECESQKRQLTFSATKTYILNCDFLCGQAQSLTQDDLYKILIAICNATNMNPNDLDIATTETGISIAPRTANIESNSSSSMVSPTSGLSGGALAGVVIAILALAVVIVVFVVLLPWRLKSVAGNYIKQ